MKKNDALWNLVISECKEIDRLENLIARRDYGCNYDELDEDTQGLVTMDAYDVLNA